MLNTLVNMVIPISIFFVIIIDFFFFIEESNGVKFKNAILDLDTNKLYSLKDIENIFMNANNRSSIDDYSFISIEKYIKQVKGNLLDKNTKYYTYTFCISYIINIFRRRKYINNKESLVIILSSILQELENEKKFFGLNSKEKELAKELSLSNNLSDVDRKNINELKDIVTIRYKELLDRNEQSDRISKKAMRLGYISIGLTVIASFEFIKKILLNMLT
ncbi:hypothetical protein [Aliarcobacter cryaerophilus]|uniref:hypothetical protein n=1 Tax=Aliarcobacter cryaerophilus TaxID=28198 RepID=UPI0008268D41|nr:hypothetical protein [Aliarcobacter cryaerophilus]